MVKGRDKRESGGVVLRQVEEFVESGRMVTRTNTSDTSHPPN